MELEAIHSESAPVLGASNAGDVREWAPDARQHAVQELILAAIARFAAFLNCLNTRRS
jgi:hypothetical protein